MIYIIFVLYTVLGFHTLLAINLCNAVIDLCRGNACTNNDNGFKCQCQYPRGGKFCETIIFEGTTDLPKTTVSIYPENLIKLKCSNNKMIIRLKRNKSEMNSTNAFLNNCAHTSLDESFIFFEYRYDQCKMNSTVIFFC